MGGRERGARTIACVGAGMYSLSYGLKNKFLYLKFLVLISTSFGEKCLILLVNSTSATCDVYVVFSENLLSLHAILHKTCH